MQKGGCQADKVATRQIHVSACDRYTYQYFTLPDKQIIKVRSVLLYGACDLSAISLFLNMLQFNGKYGCPACLCSGELLNLDSGGRTHIYPYNENPPIRTAEKTKRHGNIVLETNDTVMGVKGIKPPKFIHCMPRNIEELVHWKSSELKIWLFYYSVPVLHGIMTEKYFQHYLLLVAGIASQ
ncbi:hypothetical protein PV327_011029 [Microctonus hyperodae]|uniref:Uncharacterized protein n=1 Tax=Microctonus hyperodae TaxID=165561 RepID=A0AA39C7S8_MICHY|nr:hypothetical protein PV327_011029 [Microctonus hyperodae]